MNERHVLHGRIKRFWLFLVVASIAAFVSNAAIQIVLKGEINLNSTITTSLTLGIVLAIVMASQHRLNHK